MAYSGQTERALSPVSCGRNPGRRQRLRPQRSFVPPSGMHKLVGLTDRLPHRGDSHVIAVKSLELVQARLG